MSLTRDKWFVVKIVRKWQIMLFGGLLCYFGVKRTGFPFTTDDFSDEFYTFKAQNWI